MTGPFPKGSRTASILPWKRKNWGHLEPGRRYAVVREFHDHDKTFHPAGEAWVFLGYSYHPMDEGLLLFVSFDGQQEWELPMQGGADRQGEVLDYFEQYVQVVNG